MNEGAWTAEASGCLKTHNERRDVGPPRKLPVTLGTMNGGPRSFRSPESARWRIRNCRGHGTAAV